MKKPYCKRDVSIVAHSSQPFAAANQQQHPALDANTPVEAVHSSLRRGFCQGNEVHDNEGVVPSSSESGSGSSTTRIAKTFPCSHRTAAATSSVGEDSNRISWILLHGLWARRSIHTLRSPTKLGLMYCALRSDTSCRDTSCFRWLLNSCKLSAQLGDHRAKRCLILRYSSLIPSFSFLLHHKF
jgi:hypothetical protein